MPRRGKGPCEAGADQGMRGVVLNGVGEVWGGVAFLAPAPRTFTESPTKGTANFHSLRQKKFAARFPKHGGADPFG